MMGINIERCFEAWFFEVLHEYTGVHVVIERSTLTMKQVPLAIIFELRP